MRSLGIGWQQANEAPRMAETMQGPDLMRGKAGKEKDIASFGLNDRQSRTRLDRVRHSTCEILLVPAAAPHH